MKVQAMQTFCGDVNATSGDIIEVDSATKKDLIEAGYAKEVETKKVEKPAKKTEVVEG